VGAGRTLPSSVSSRNGSEKRKLQGPRWHATVKLGTLDWLSFSTALDLIFGAFWMATFYKQSCPLCDADAKYCWLDYQNRKFNVSATMKDA